MFKKLYEMVLNEQTDSLEKMKIEADGNIISKTVQNNFKTILYISLSLTQIYELLYYYFK